MTGIFFFHECGKKMYNSRQKATHYTEKRFGKEYQHKVADFYTCSTYSLSKGVFDEKCSQHYIRTEVVRQLVFSAIRNVCGYVRENRAEFESKSVMNPRYSSNTNLQSIHNFVIYRMQLGIRSGKSEQKQTIAQSDGWDKNVLPFL